MSQIIKMNDGKNEYTLTKTTTDTTITYTSVTNEIHCHFLSSKRQLPSGSRDNIENVTIDDIHYLIEHDEDF